MLFKVRSLKSMLLAELLEAADFGLFFLLPRICSRFLEQGFDLHYVVRVALISFASSSNNLRHS